MGTRSLTFVYDEEGNKIINLYRQFDGYPTGHGQELGEFLSSGSMVNGLRLGADEKFFNGMGCMAAQLVSHFKKESGGFYLYPTTVEDCGQDYEYHVSIRNGLLSGSAFHIKIMDCGFNVFGMTQDDTYKPLFEGDLEQFLKYCNSEKYGEVQVNAPKTVFEGSDIGQDWLKSVLRDGVATVKFEKNDGTERVMKCTLKQDLVPQVPVVEGVEKKTKAQSPDVLPVYDVEANGWRSFRWDSIKSVEIGI
jgi:hypothetical protein